MYRNTRFGEIMKGLRRGFFDQVIDQTEADKHNKGFSSWDQLLVMVYAHISGSTKAAEIGELLERGVLVTVNSDDPAYFPGYVADNLAVLQSEAGLSREAVVQLVRNSFTISWLHDVEQTHYLRRLEEWVASH